MAQPIRFIYQNSAGEIKEQALTNYGDEGTHFSGYSEAHGMVRTFRKDRVLEWLEGGDELLRTARRSGDLSVLFTGFAQAERDRLEDCAMAEGMRVRRTVSDTLDFLCTGANAGARKVAQAQECGVTVLDAEQFVTLLELGELPDEAMAAAPAPQPEQAPPTRKPPRPARQAEIAARTGAHNEAELQRLRAASGKRRKQSGQRRWHWPSFCWGFLAGWTVLIVLALMGG